MTPVILLVMSCAASFLAGALATFLLCSRGRGTGALRCESLSHRLAFDHYARCRLPAGHSGPHEGTSMHEKVYWK